MTATSSTVLRPLRIGEILDRAISLYRQNFFKYVGIIALVQIPLVLVQLLSSVLTVGNVFGRLNEMLANPAAAPESPLEVFGPAYLAGASLGGLVTIASLVLVQGVATAALTRAIANAYLGTDTAGILGTYRSIKDVWIHMVAAILLAVVLSLVLAVWWFVPCVGWLTGGGMLLFMWLVIIPLLAPVVVLEHKSPTVAWRRAWNLARRRFWWVLGFALLLYLFNLLVVAGPAAVVASIGQFAVGDPFDLSRNAFALQTVVQSLTTLVTSLLFLPLQVASMTLLYFDLRVQSEGLDLALATKTGEESNELSMVRATAPSPNDGSLLSGTDWRNFVLVTVLGAGLFVALYAVLLGVILAVASAFGAGI